jgi:nucleoside-diphosphate-sugar epimerase
MNTGVNTQKPGVNQMSQGVVAVIGDLHFEEDQREKLETYRQYAYNKARCEELLFAAHERGDLVVTSIRPGHTYGEGGNNLLHALGRGNCHVDRLRKEQPIIVYGNGTSFWPTCHRDDVSVAFVGAVGNEKAKGQRVGPDPDNFNF